MAYQCKIIKDSINPCGNRLTTFVVTYPRFIHSELLTHRSLARNSSSSRAIPVSKMIQQVQEDPAMPIHWGKNQKGMAAEEELSQDAKNTAKDVWLDARDDALCQAERLMDLGVHKQIVNRILEPFSWITVIISATDFANFFNLRCHKAAMPEIQKIAWMMADAYYTQKPTLLEPGYWHLPFIDEGDREEEPNEIILSQISAARSARVSFLNFDGKRSIEADLVLYEKLVGQIPRHSSSLEHPAMALHRPDRHGNFTGWLQLRKNLSDENLTVFDYENAKRSRDI